MLTTIKPPTSASALEAKHQHLRDILHQLGAVVVAFSGGVDSALLLKVAYDVLGEDAVGAIALSVTIPASEVQEAEGLAGTIGVRLISLHTEEMLNAAYLVNDARRCYHCKDELFAKLRPLAESLGIPHIAYGVNADDVADYRPGQQAAEEWGVRGPLLEADLHKDEIRRLSRQLHLPTWNKPAMACLSSRVPHGQPITKESIQMIEEAEKCIRSLGLYNVRVRSHGETARIEVDADSLHLLVEPEMRGRVSARLHELGYRYVTLDLDGFRSGSTSIASD